jgi:NADPH2:quinone reductase
MSQAVLLHEPGPPENFSYEDITVADPGPGEAQMRQAFSGINFIDTHFRSGLYSPGDLPAVLGREGAGVITKLGEGVTDLSVGQRAAYGSVMGSYAEIRNIDASRLVPVPDEIADDVAAAMMLKGLTAQFLVRQVRKIGKGDTILIQAVAGGVGLILCQWAKHLGATVIGTVSSAEKAAIAKTKGCDHVILYEDVDFVEAVLDLTGGRGADAVYDAVGVKTFEGSMAATAEFGTVAHYGAPSGPIPPEVFGKLPRDRFLIRPTLPGFSAKRENLLAMADDLFAVVKSGGVSIEINQRFALKDVALAHVALESRRTTGSTVLEI